MKISIIIPTLNNENEIDKFFSSLNKQIYPKNQIEIIAVDGGSKDATARRLKSNGVKVIPNPHVLAEPGVSLGIANASGDIIMTLAMDNFFYNPNALKTIAGVFENKSIYAAFPKQDYDSSDNLFTKYHNTFTDPFNHFVNREASNARTFHKVYKKLVHNEIYSVYDFYSSKTIPMISFSQGFTVRRSFRRKKQDLFDDNSPVIDLIRQNKKIAYIHSVSIYHHTIKNLQHFIKKQRWATQNALERKNYGIAHRYNKLSEAQKLRIRLWPLYAFSIVLPAIDALSGVFKDRDLIWLFHPLNCFLCAYANTVQVLKFIINKIFNKSVIIFRQ